MAQGKIRAFIGAFLISSSAFAGDLALQFKDVPVNQFVQAIIKGVLHQDYVITPDASVVDNKVSLSVTGLDLEGVRATFSDVLATVGLRVTDRRGVLYVEKRSGTDVSLVDQARSAFPAFAAPSLPVSSVSSAPVQSSEPLPGDEPKIYFPKYRSSEYLALAVRAAGAKLITNQPNQPSVMMGSLYPGMMQVPVQQPVQPQTSSLFRDVLVFAGSPEAVHKVEKLLSQLDRPSVAVQLRGVVLEVTDNSENVRSFSAALGLLGGKVGLVWAAGEAVGNAITLKSSTLNAVLSAVDGDTRFRALSEPTLRVLEGESAKLVVGQEVPIRGAITTDKNGNSMQNVEYKTSGLVFDVTPTVYESMLRLKINQQVSSFTRTTTSGIDSPTLLKREASTVVQADDGELIAIGGLDETKDTAQTSGLPFVPSWMRSKNDSRQKSQIMLLLEVKKVPMSAI